MATVVSLIPILTAFFLLLILNLVATSEIQALTAFKLAIHDPLTVLESRNRSTPSAPCDWRGIACFRGQVCELLLPQLQLSGPISPQIGDLRHLRKPSLHSNSFNGSIPRSLSRYSLLRFPMTME
ncbi:Probable LRR receptor-like serine/threonine-protein kinase At4g36180 [Linum grandiflorum]